MVSDPAAPREVRPHKRIVFFCDGTWNKADADRPTSILRLAQAVAPTAAGGIKQVVFYQQGVGTGRGTTRLARWTDKFLGGALGWGLEDNIIEAYRNLVFCYEPGDHIHIFGFSRGAYTARSLAGLIRKAGILPRDKVHLVGAAMDLYRQRGTQNAPDEPAIRARRAALSPDVATSPDDVMWRLTESLLDRHGESPILVQIRYLGVLDTVGALGLPSFLGLFARLVNDRYAFHDTDLSHLVLSARHAVALDERRWLYRPALWGNLDRDPRKPELGPEGGLNRGDTGPDRPYRQIWFPGVHGVVGGSGTVPGLSAFPAEWIAQGARSKDVALEFDRRALQEITAPADPAADASTMIQKRGFSNLYGFLLGDREGPTRAADVAESARQRVIRLGGYRPGSLRRVLRDLFGPPAG
ncbi:MAG: T6SS phospholipase effector Tle1-like catalytic domain-containing protein [Paracoccaceae bacterium]|uniref:T6SS phospholipase effector Tle1-like catalytic domain-containing protein n=1 Tax=Seohaeicola saemankumensis TaxID=481181 RepID=UPI001E3020B6|nr:DUF2235 domain-containing protein [Seohaeicola saemankumensis]MCD1624418.1 DUF2235 domain-containing protein [Seohaeicola saemankumensis]